jgi:hypothetical protein
MQPLFSDTDSIIYLHPKGQPPPFQVGDMLGQMSKEHAQEQIRAFYCGGCKQVTIMFIIKSTSFSPLSMA